MTKMFKALLPMLLALVLTVGASASAGNVITGAAEIPAVPGGTVLYPIHVEGDLPMAAAVLYVECDTAVFSMEKDGSGDYIVQPGTMTGDGSWLAADYGKSGWRVAWFQNSNSTPDGVLCYLPLQISKDAPLGSYPISIRVSAENTINADGTPVPCAAVNGEIIIEADQPTLYTTEAKLTAGMVVDVPVLLRNAPDLMGLHLVFEDNATAELVRDEKGKPIYTLGSALAGSGIVMENIYGADGWQMVWYSTQAKAVNDLLVTLRVRILADAGEQVDLPVAVDRRNTLDENYQMQDCVLKTVGLQAEALRMEQMACDRMGETLTVSGSLSADPILNGESLWLLAAAYDADGRMIALAEGAVEEDSTFAMDLTAGQFESLSVFALDPTRGTPYCAAYRME